jgi:hypothetical protein
VADRQFLPIEQIERCAGDTLSEYARQLGCAPRFPLDAEEVAKLVFGLEVYYDGEGFLDSIDRTLLGALYPDGHICPATDTDRMIVVNSAPRFRHVTPGITILHEVGHYRFHFPQDRLAPNTEPAYCREGHISGQRELKVPPREWQASRFASEVLMQRDKVVEVLGGKKPGDLVNLRHHGDRFRRIFGVSQGAMEKRLFDLGYRCIMGRYGYANANLTGDG